MLFLSGFEVCSRWVPLIKAITAYSRIQLFQRYSFEVAGYFAVTPQQLICKLF